MNDFDARIASLTVSQRALLARRLDAADAGAAWAPLPDLSKRGIALVAYAVSRDSRVPSSDALRHYLGERLPDYMVPSSFVFVDELPFTSSGKIDKQKLPDADASVMRGDAVARPRTPAEETLSQIWVDVLGFDEVGLNDNFFEMGGDSLTSIRIIARSRQKGLEFTPKQFFDNPTIAGIVAVVTGAAVSEPSPPVERQGVYSRDTHRPRTIRRLVSGFLSSLRVLISHGPSEGAGGFTPSDFPLADVDQEDLE